MKNLLSKTTQNYAYKRGLWASLLDIDKGYTLLTIGLEDEETDAELVYKCFDGESFTYCGNTWLDNDLKAELPAHIRNEKHLREVLDFIGKEAV